ncbi:MAG: hypothetical protein JXR64_06635, partial [Spirochaetales bacterium]|nr:hypothetical protein [Spirochaetales bacterium]
MLPVYFIILPLFFAFLSAGLRGLKCVKKGWLPTIYLGVSTIMSLFMFNNLSDGPINQIIVVAPPLGINLYAGNFSVIVILAISLFGMILTSSPKLRSFFSESNAANILVLLHFAGINGLLLSGDLFNIFVFLEIVSLSAYAITAFNDDSKSFEAAIKYIIVGSFVSILLLIGIAAIYYHGGTLNLAQISNLFLEFSPKVKIVIIVTIIIALLIEAEIFPFNTWVPDV